MDTAYTCKRFIFFVFIWLDRMVLYDYGRIRLGTPHVFTSVAADHHILFF